MPEDLFKLEMLGAMQQAPQLSLHCIISSQLNAF